jgi:hypothetical protein
VLILDHPPVGFVASLSNVESLTEFFPFLMTVVENYPWFGQLLAQLAHLILVVFISLLPQILLAFVGLEKHICLATLQHPLLFNKVAWLTIIQTFFVSTLSGSITSELQKITENHYLPLHYLHRPATYSGRSCTKLPGTWCGTPLYISHCPIPPSALCWKVTWV